jgi:hypothetical protein
MKWLIDISEETITDLRHKNNLTEVDVAVMHGTPCNGLIPLEELQELRDRIFYNPIFNPEWEKPYKDISIYKSEIMADFDNKIKELTDGNIL